MPLWANRRAESDDADHGDFSAKELMDGVIAGACSLVVFVGWALDLASPPNAEIESITCATSASPQFLLTTLGATVAVIVVRLRRWPRGHGGREATVVTIDIVLLVVLTVVVAVQTLAVWFSRLLKECP